MAGEIHNFDRKKKKRVSWQDDRSTNKYYSSGEVSTIKDHTSVSDTSLKPGQEPKAIPTVKPRLDDKSTDKYYANKTPVAPTKQQLAKGTKSSVKPSSQKKEVSTKRPVNTDVSMVVNDNHEVNGVLQEVAARLQNGDTGLVLYVQKGNSNLLRRTRAALEMLVTREAITEEQYHEVRLSYTLGDDEKEVTKVSGEPKPSGEVNPEEKEALFVDTHDFLADKAALPEKNPTEVMEEGDDDNDFLLHKEPESTPSSTEVAPSEVAPSETTKPVEYPQQNRKPGRRSGRGMR